MCLIRSQICYQTVLTFLWAIYHDLPRCDCCGMLQPLHRVTTAIQHSGGFTMQGLERNCPRIEY